MVCFLANSNKGSVGRNSSWAEFCTAKTKSMGGFNCDHQICRTEHSTDFRILSGDNWHSIEPLVVPVPFKGAVPKTSVTPAGPYPPRVFYKNWSCLIWLNHPTWQDSILLSNTGMGTRPTKSTKLWMTFMNSTIFPGNLHPFTVGFPPFLSISSHPVHPQNPRCGHWPKRPPGSMACTNKEYCPAWRTDSGSIWK